MYSGLSTHPSTGIRVIISIGGILEHISIGIIARGCLGSKAFLLPGGRLTERSACHSDTMERCLFVSRDEMPRIRYEHVSIFDICVQILLKVDAQVFFNRHHIVFLQHAAHQDGILFR